MKSITAFIFGALSGVLGGLLFAPKEGKKMRLEAKKAANDQLNDIEKAFNQKSNELIKDYNTKVDEYKKKGRSLIGDLTEKAKVNAR